MQMNKFGRVIQVRVGNKEYTNEMIDIDFMYNFDDSIENNVSEINLWNINNDTIGHIKKGTPVVLSAGYGDDVGVILIGKVGDFETNYHSVDREFKMYVSDGLSLWGTSVKKTYENLTASAIINDVLGIVGIKVGKVQLGKDKNYTKLVLNNSVEHVLNLIAKDTDSKFYIKNGNGYFVSKEYADANAVLLNKDSGLLGSPERQTIDDKIGWKVSCLLEHRISVGSYVQIESKTANGNFRVVKGSHNSDFITEIEVLPL